MGHTKPEDLKDLGAEFEAIRALDDVVEKGPGTFYLKRVPFLHFHDKDGKRWADVKTKTGWKNLAIDFKASASVRRDFLASVRRAHEALRPKGKAK